MHLNNPIKTPAPANLSDWLMYHWLVLVVILQETVVKTLGNELDHNTLETFTLAEQLSTNLTDLNVRIEGTTLSWVVPLGNKYYWWSFWGLFLQAAYSDITKCSTISLWVKIHLWIVSRDDQWLGAVQCSSGYRSRGGPTEHRVGPGNGDWNEEDGPVSSRARRHWRVNRSPWL